MLHNQHEVWTLIVFLARAVTDVVSCFDCSLPSPLHLANRMVVRGCLSIMWDFMNSHTWLWGSKPSLIVINNDVFIFFNLTIGLLRHLLFVYEQTEAHFIPSIGECFSMRRIPNSKLSVFKIWYDLKKFLQWCQVGTPKTHRRYLAREEGTYGPIPRRTPKGLLGMPFNTTVSSSILSNGFSVIIYLFRILNKLSYAMLNTAGHKWSILCWW